MAFIDLEKAFDSAKNGDMVGASEVGCWRVDGVSGKVDVRKLIDQSKDRR